jgi:hypothetical protein
LKDRGVLREALCRHPALLNADTIDSAATYEGADRPALGIEP